MIADVHYHVQFFYCPFQRRNIKNYLGIVVEKKIPLKSDVIPYDSMHQHRSHLLEIKYEM